MKKENEDLIFGASLTAIAMVFFYFMFGVPGALFVTAILVMCIPIFMLLRLAKLELPETIILSLLLGFTAFPSIVYLLGFFISFKLSIFLISALMIAASFLTFRIGMTK